MDGEWSDEPDADASAIMDPLKFRKAANKAYVDSSIAWRYSHEYQPKEGIDFSDTYQEYLNKIVYPRNNTLPDNDKVPPSLKEFIQFCLSNNYMMPK